MRHETKFTFILGLISAVCVYCYSIHQISAKDEDGLLNSDAFHPENKLSAYYQCYSNPRAVEEVLKNFRHFYPSSEIIMVNDGGDLSLKTLAKYYNAKYSYSNRTSDRKSSMFFSSDIVAFTYFSRILDASADCDWLLLLEDDVWVLDRIPLHTFHHTLNGGHSEMILDDILAEVIWNSKTNTTKPANHPDEPLQYAGNGGTIMRCSFFRDIKRMAIWKEDIAAILRAKPVLASDELISSITYLAGGSIGTFRGYMEPKFFWFLYSFLTGDISVLHQAKFLYQ